MILEQFESMLANVYRKVIDHRIASTSWKICTRCRIASTASAKAAAAAKDFHYEDIMSQTGPLDINYKKLTGDYVSTFHVDGKQCLKVQSQALQLLASTAMTDIAHLLRPSHLQQLRKILDDPEASSNDRFVALELLKVIYRTAYSMISKLYHCHKELKQHY